MTAERWRRYYRPSILGAILLLLVPACVGGNHTATRPSQLRTATINVNEERGGPDLTPADPLTERDTALELTPDLEPGAELQVSRDGALLTALMNNPGLQVAQLGPGITGAFVPQEQARFDPELMATLSHGKSREQLAGAEEFTFGSTANAEGGLLPPIVGPDSRSTAANVLELASDQIAEGPFEPPTRRDIAARATGFLSEQLRPPEPDNLEEERSLGEITVSSYFPTGTSVFLTGGLTREESNFVATEYDGRWTVGVNQALLRGAGTDVNLAALRQAHNSVAQSEYELQSYLLDLTEQVERAYWDLALAKEVLAIRDFAVELAEEQLRRSEDLLAVGETVQAAVQSARAEKASREAERYEAIGELQNAAVRLLRLLGAPEESSWQLDLTPVDDPSVERVPIERLESKQLAVHHRPELRQLELDIHSRDLDVTVARNQRLPELNLFAEYGLTSLDDGFGGSFRHLNETRYYNYEVGLQLNTPILRRAERARHNQARLEATQAERRLVDERLSVRSEVSQALNDVESRWQRIAASEMAVESREEELRIEQNRYEVGLVTHLDVLQVQRLLIEAQVNAATARVEYIKALTTLYAAEGTLLERRGIRLDPGANST